MERVRRVLSKSSIRKGRNMHRNGYIAYIGVFCSIHLKYFIKPSKSLCLTFNDSDIVCREWSMDWMLGPTIGQLSVIGSYLMHAHPMMRPGRQIVAAMHVQAPMQKRS